MNKKALTITIVLLITIGIIYRLFLTSGGDFLFNMDNARDMVDVREMVILGKLRLIGPRSAIEGLFNGPAWYYLLAIPFLISGGNPYASIIMEIILWTVGGFFLLKLMSRFGILAMLISGSLWIVSDYIVLTNLYAFNPNPVLLLTPLFIFLLEKYLISGKFIFVLSSFFLAGLFFNFEMNAGIFFPFIIFFSILFSKIKLLKNRNFWLASLGFIVTIAPQVLFDIKHQFIMSESIFKFLTKSPEKTETIFRKALTIYEAFYNTLSATLMNKNILAQFTVLLSAFFLLNFFGRKKYLKDFLTTVCFMIIFMPAIGYLILSVKINPWHLGGSMTALIMLISIILSKLSKLGFIEKGFSLVASALILFYAASSLVNYFTHDRFIISQDPSLFKNEISAIDYVYKYANGKNFKVYTYLPSVYDYPYQYLIWWHGKKEFGYLPADYAYLPNKPEYISEKAAFSAKEEDLKKRENSNLVFLIKEPNYRYTRFGWEGDFVKLKSVSKQMIGPLEVEVRKESTE